MMKKVKTGGILILTALTFCFIAMLFPPVSNGSEIYKWKDKDGKLHFGDRPPKKDRAERVNEKLLASRMSSVKTVTVKLAPVDYGINRQSNMLIMYATSRCPYCKKARQYFAKNNIEYIEKNIEFSSDAKDEHKRLGGKGVPLFLAGRYQMEGFSQSGFKRFYEKVFPSHTGNAISGKSQKN